MIRQRVLGLALGYENRNDQEQLRTDPLPAVACENPDLLGQNRRHERDRGKALAGKSTLTASSLELSATPPANTATTAFLPLYCSCGDIPLCAELRTSDRDGSQGTLEALQRIIPAIRKRLGNKVKIIIRGDSGFCRDELMTWIEEQAGVHYVFGLARNSRLETLLQPTFQSLHASHTAACEAARSEAAKRRTPPGPSASSPIRPRTVGAERGASSARPRSLAKKKTPASSLPI